MQPNGMKVAYFFNIVESHDMYLFLGINTDTCAFHHSNAVH